MANRRPKSGMTIIYWGAIALACIAFGTWCVFDGWFGKPGGPDPTYNQVMAVGCFIALAYVIYRGLKEYRKVRRLALS